uniref:Uncharacterized protein n=1 Tax=Pinctada fucata TaxID=50426 RepID=A0A194AMN1_PINFU
MTGGSGIGSGSGSGGISGTGTGTGTGGGMTGSGNCRDVLPNCAEYTSASCGDPYVDWAQKNCAKFCGYCGGNGTINVGGNVGPGFSGSGTGGTGSGTGSGTGGMSGGFVTAVPGQTFTGQGGGCYYKGQLYKQGEQWRDGCDYNCTCSDASRGYYTCRALCPTWSNLPQGCTLVKPQGECCSQPKCQSGTGSGTGTGMGTGTGGSMTGTGGGFTGSGTGGSGSITGQGSGCLYKGKTYTQGQQFDDGCTYKCTCIDASRGQYTCNQKCINWQLPPACTLNPPAPGKCCKTPNCPAGYVINYPPNYVAE